MLNNGTVRCVVLDAMGVIFRAADDVEELLVPFVAASGGTGDSALIRAAYMGASLGVIEADAFWTTVGLSPAVEDEYLAKHSLVSGVNEFLHYAKSASVPVWCLSNDVGRWAEKLRAQFSLDSLLAGAVISGYAGSRKPSREIYQQLLTRSGYCAADLLFLDDREKNVAAALALGIPSVKFDSSRGYALLSKQLFDVDV